MKKLTLIMAYVVIMIAIAGKATAQVSSPDFCTGTDGQNCGTCGGAYLYTDTVSFFDHTPSICPCTIKTWTWVFTGAVIDTVTYTTFKPRVSAQWTTPGYHNVEMWIESTNGYVGSCQSAIHLDFLPLSVGDEGSNIFVSGLKEKEAVELYDMSGHLLGKKVYTGGERVLFSADHGIYFVRIISNQRAPVAKKVIKM